MVSFIFLVRFVLIVKISDLFHSYIFLLER